MSAILELIKPCNLLGSNLRVTRTQRPHGFPKGRIHYTWPPTELMSGTSSSQTLESKWGLTPKGDRYPAARAAWSGSIWVNGWDWDKGVCMRRARDGVSSGRRIHRVPVGSSLCAPFPKGEACNYNKAAILYCWLPWKVCILLGRAAIAQTHPAGHKTPKIDQSRGSPWRERRKGVDGLILCCINSVCVCLCACGHIVVGWILTRCVNM